MLPASLQSPSCFFLAGASFATAFAQGRDSNLPLGTNPRYDRPLVSTQAYVAVPQLLGGVWSPRRPRVSLTPRTAHCPQSCQCLSVFLHAPGPLHGIPCLESLAQPRPCIHNWLSGWTTFPTFGYSLAEARGTTLSTSNGYFVVGELAYNGLSNTFGVSLSQVRALSGACCVYEHQMRLTFLS